MKWFLSVKQRRILKRRKKSRSKQNLCKVLIKIYRHGQLLKHKKMKKKEIFTLA